jgi:hypothetical protein
MVFNPAGSKGILSEYFRLFSISSSYFESFRFSGFAEALAVKEKRANAKLFFNFGYFVNSCQSLLSPC